MRSPLPTDKTTRGACWPKCPWCDADLSEATVTVDQLLSAWEHGVTARPPRNEFGEPDECALTTTCPACGKPVMIALQQEGEKYPEFILRFLAIRTKADVAFLQGAGAW